MLDSYEFGFYFLWETGVSMIAMLGWGVGLRKGVHWRGLKVCVDFQQLTLTDF